MFQEIDNSYEAVAYVAEDATMGDKKRNEYLFIL